MSDAAALPAEETPALYGLIAEFGTPEELLAAATTVKGAGYSQFEAYSPFPIEGLDEAIGHRPTRIGYVILAVAVVTALGGFFMQYFADVIMYPLNIGGKPFNSWPNFIPVAFETMILLTGITAAVVMIVANGLPRPNHPIFNAPGFGAASRDKFFLCVETSDPKFNEAEVGALLATLNPERVAEVEY
jgi:hypothetical protein